MMPHDLAPTRAQLLFGTDEPIETPKRLRAGDLSADFERGALRDVRWGGLEVLRGLAFVVRDTRWGTTSPLLSDIVIEESADGFHLVYEGRVEGGDGVFRYTVRIVGKAEGRLTASATGRSPEGFRTNRTGFVVLHPLERAAGHRLEVGHPDGTKTHTVFPALIKPDQPATAITRLRHEPVSGVQVDVGFSGDVFEMEDHRNWTDASFKTYVRPLSRGFPYRIEADEVLAQAVDLRVSGAAPVDDTAAGSAIAVHWGEPGDGAMPALGLYADASVLADATPAMEVVAGLGPNYIQARIDLREAAAAEQLEHALRLARSCACALHLDAVIAGREPVAELAPLIDWAGRVRPALESLFIIPARDLHSRPSGSIPSGEASVMAILDAARRLFPGVRLGGGMPVGFPELNRNRPPTGIDWVAHATQAVVHAADDRSVMQTIEALPHLVAAMRDLVGGLPYRIGPATIGMVPSASASPPIETAGDRRTALGARDPRQAGLFAAAFMLGYVAAADDVQAITPATPIGDFGLLNADGHARPAAAVFTGLAACAGRPRLRATHDAPGRLAAIATSAVGGAELWVANLTSEPVDVRLNGPTAYDLLMIDAERLAHSPADRLAAEPLPSFPLRLDAYAVCRVRVSRS